MCCGTIHHLVAIWAVAEWPDEGFKKDFQEFLSRRNGAIMSGPRLDVVGRFFVFCPQMSQIDADEEQIGVGEDKSAAVWL